MRNATEAHQPRRVHVGARQPAARATRSCCRTWSTTPMSSRGTCSRPSGASSCGGSRSPTTSASTSSNLDQLLDGAQAAGDQRDVERARHDQRHPAARRRRARARRARRSSMRVSTCRTSPPTCRRGTPTSSRSPRTSCCGPSGIGALWGRAELLEAMPPFLGGGEMIRDVRVEGFTPNDIPWKFEAGTQAIVEAIGFGAAVDYLQGLGMDDGARPRDAAHALRPRRTRATRFPDTLTIYGPQRRLDPRRRGVVPVRRHPRARHQPGPRRGRGVRARRTPLRQAAHAPARRTGHEPGVVLRLQRRQPTSTCSSRRWPRPQKFFAPDD